MPEILRSVLFVDFDNVFFSLQSADKEAAKAFANDPQGWLEAIESGALIEEGQARAAPVRRRILMRRCYANPAVMRYFRGWFTRSGFQIVDCPPLTGKGKNSADIYMVVDMLDALRHETHFDEFIILSGDADFTPVLTRLRAYDRRSVIYSNAVTASAYKSLCDGMITEERLIDLAVGDDDEDLGEAAPPAPRPERRPEPRLTSFDAPRLPPAGDLRTPDARPAENRPPDFRMAEGRMAEARMAEPRAVEARAPDLRQGQVEPRQPGQRRTYERRSAPRSDESATEAPGQRLPHLPAELDALVRRVSAATSVPPFAPEVYASVFRALAAEVQERGFSLNRTVNGVIRRLAEGGLKPRPQAVAFVIKGLMLSGHEFLATDTAGTLAKAFRRQALYLAANADLVLADQERLMVGAWIVGALRNGASTAAETSADEIPSDPHRAAEAAGVSIEETLHELRSEPDDEPDAPRGAAGEAAEGAGDAPGSFDDADENEDGDEGPDDEGPDDDGMDEDGPDDDGSDDEGEDDDGEDGSDARREPGTPARPARNIEALLARIRRPTES